MPDILFLGTYTYSQARNQELFRAGEVSENKGTSTNISSETYERKTPQGKFQRFFSQIRLKQHFKWELKPIDEASQGIFPQNQGTFL